MDDKYRKIRKVSEETALSLGVVFIICTILYALSKTIFQVEANTGDIVRLDKVIAKYERRSLKNERRLYRIEGALKIKEREDLDGEE